MRFKEWTWILPLALLMGAALSFAQPGDWWRGSVSFGLLAALALWSMRRAWLWAGGEKMLAWAMALALALRLLAGIAWTVLLPAYGYDTPQQNAGYVFYDAFRRDEQSWELAGSGESLLSAFDQSYSADQYGGLLAFTALIYRVFSPDAHRSLLPVLFGAWAAAVSIAFAWRAIAAAFGESYAAPAVWLLSLYPESILMGSSQMREPFLIALVIILTWGYVAWGYLGRRTGWGWLAFGLAGMLLLSPGVAVFALLWLSGGLWLRREHTAATWRALGVAAVVSFVALALFAVGAVCEAPTDDVSFTAVLEWFMAASQWDILLLERSSGWVQKLFAEMPAGFKIPFVTVYGALQPVLPAAFIEPSLAIWQALGIARAMGWYALVPFLAFGGLSLLWRRGPDRRLWAWMLGIALLWIVISALRAGGDQWDNPRYRVIFLLVQALVFAYAWQARRNAWFWRIVAVEGVFLLFFTHWYISRYFALFGQLPFFVMVALIIVIGTIILVGGAAWDAWRARRSA